MRRYKDGVPVKVSANWLDFGYPRLSSNESTKSYQGRFRYGRKKKGGMSVAQPPHILFLDDSIKIHPKYVGDK